MAKTYSVFISSTFLDLETEREKVMQAVLRLGYLPLGMEMFPASNDTQRDAIRRAIDLADYYVVLVAGRYGSLGPNNLSYTEGEYDYAVEQKIPVLAFVHGDPQAIPQGKTDQNDEARKRLEAFRAKVGARMRDTWTNPDELAAKVTAALIHAVQNDPRPGWVRGVAGISDDGRTVRPGPAPAPPVRAESPQASSAAVRQYMQASDYRYDELLSQAVLRATELVATIRADRPVSDEEFLALLRSCEEASADLVRIAAEAAYFGKGAHHDVLIDAVAQLATVEARGGYTSLNALRVYPAVLAFYAAGVPTVRRSDYTLLRKFHALQLNDPGAGGVPALRILSPSYALRGPVHPPLEGGRTWKTPQSERILEAIRAPVLELPMMKLKDSYEQAFSRFEYLNALAAALAEGVHPYYGRFLWYPDGGRLSENGLAEATNNELKQQGKGWPPFAAGLFGGEFEDFQKAKAELDREAARYSLRWL